MSKTLTKTKALKIVNERIGEILLGVKRAFDYNVEDHMDVDSMFRVVDELRAIKVRLWSCK